MRIRVLLFAAVADQVGQSERDVDVPDGSTVADALDRLAADHAPIAAMRDRLATAVDMTYVKPDHVLQDGDELALIPPVSGG